MAARPKQVAQATTMAKAGSSAKQIQNKTGVSAKRAGNLAQKATKSAPVNRTFTNSAGDVVQQQASTAATASAQQRLASLQQTNGGNVQSQFIPGLMAPGQMGYDASTGGGNFVFARGNIDPEALRAWYRTGSTDLAEGDRSKYTLEALNPATNATAAAAAPQATAKKRGGLAGAGANVSRREALKIAKGKDISVAQVMDRALGRGQTLGASLVNKYNAGKLDDRSYIQKATDRVYGNMGGKSQYQPESLSRLGTFGKMPKGSTYGVMTSTGVPILDMKPPKNTMGTSPKGAGPSNTTPVSNDLGNASNNGSDLGNTTVADTAPTETPTNGINIDLGGSTDIFSNATGFRTKKSSRRGGDVRAQNLGSQRVSPIGGWNYNLG
jgi:hypothetical protein